MTHPNGRAADDELDSKTGSKVPSLPPLDPEAFEETARQNALARMDDADQQAITEIDESREVIEQFFARLQGRE